MPATARYLEESGVVETVHRGDVTLADIKRGIELAAGLCLENDCASVLTDVSEGDHAQLSVLDVYAIPELLQGAGLSRRLRIAVLRPSSEKGRDLAAFYETVSFNRGWQVVAFDSRADAIAWLAAT